MLLFTSTCRTLFDMSNDGNAATVVSDDDGNDAAALSDDDGVFPTLIASC